jgi:hypothetical protein
MLNSTKSLFPVEEKQRIIEEKLCFVDLLSSNFDLFIRVFPQSGEFLSGSASKNRFNLEDLFGCTASTIIMILLENVRCDFADISDNTFTKRLIQRCDQHKLFKTLAEIFSLASNLATQVLEERENKSLEVPWIRSLLEVMTWTLRLCHAAVDAGAKSKISNEVNPLMLGPGNLMRCLVDNTFLRFGCTKWHTWTKDSGKSEGTQLVELPLNPYTCLVKVEGPKATSTRSLLLCMYGKMKSISFGENASNFSRVLC